MYRHFISLALVRAWVAFVIIAVLAGVAFTIDGDDPLRSDDPYVLGYACGVFAAAMALVYTAAERMCKSRRSASACYFALLGLWCLFLFGALGSWHQLRGPPSIPISPPPASLSVSSHGRCSCGDACR